MPLVALTVDTEFPDQPASDPLAAGDRILTMLARRQARATFFLTGCFARAHPQAVHAIHRSGHLIGNHSYSHCSLSRLTEAGIVEDLTACHDVLLGLGVNARPWFRAPYGRVAHHTVDVEAAVARAGYRHTGWHAHGEDWRPGREPEEIARQTIDEVARRWPRPAIVLFHSWPDGAPRALELVLQELGAKGARFAGLDEIGRRQLVAGRLREAFERTRAP